MRAVAAARRCGSGANSRAISEYSAPPDSWLYTCGSHDQAFSDSADQTSLRSALRNIA